MALKRAGGESDRVSSQSWYACRLCEEESHVDVHDNTIFVCCPPAVVRRENVSLGIEKRPSHGKPLNTGNTWTWRAIVRYVWYGQQPAQPEQTSRNGQRDFHRACWLYYRHQQCNNINITEEGTVVIFGHLIRHLFKQRKTKRLLKQAFCFPSIFFSSLFYENFLLFFCLLVLKKVVCCFFFFSFFFSLQKVFPSIIPVFIFIA